MNDRTCKTCACAWVAEPPKVPTAQQLQENPDLLTGKPTRICRLNPPAFLMTQGGAKLMQQVTADYMSCWHWKPPGTLPGDAMAIPPKGANDPHAVRTSAGLIALA